MIIRQADYNIENRIWDIVCNEVHVKSLGFRSPSLNVPEMLRPIMDGISESYLDIADQRRRMQYFVRSEDGRQALFNAICFDGRFFDLHRSALDTSDIFDRIQSINYLVIGAKGWKTVQTKIAQFLLSPYPYHNEDL